jgi:hypothetical protein
MVKCPSCSTELIDKEGTKKLCAQIGNPEIELLKLKILVFVIVVMNIS